MTKVLVYRFRLYDISRDDQVTSRRWGTREAIVRLGGEVLEDTAIEVESSVLGSEIGGLSERGFDPRPRTGVQTQVYP